MGYEEPQEAPRPVRRRKDVSAQSQPSDPSQKRKRRFKDIPEDECLDSDKKSKASKKPKQSRPKRWRSAPTQDYLVKLERALSQPMFVLDRSRSHDTLHECPCETIEMAGTTGNLYTVTITAVPKCTCPSSRKDGQCKHIIYAMVRTLKVPNELQYQLSLLPSELESIFAAAPLPTADAADTDSSNGNRKPVEDDCPICCCEFADDPAAPVVWCRAACGNNVHKACFDQWARMKRAAGALVTCPFCRTPWDTKTGTQPVVDKASGRRTVDGYVNVASQLGISGVRDTSTYHSFWVRDQLRGGRTFDEDDDFV